MTDFAAATVASVQAAQVALQVVYALALTAWRYPPNCNITNGTSYDFIIVGSGSAGSILGNRLSANSSYNVLVIEAGGYPPLESDMPGLFGLLISSVYDYNITTVNDNRTAQNVRNEAMVLNAGKMLGGGGSFHHMMHIRGCDKDYNDWATIIGDDTWNYTNILSPMKKQENLTDPELLNSDYAYLYGNSGPIKMATERYSDNKEILAAIEQMGYPSLPTLTLNECTLGAAEPLYEIYNGERQSNSITYLGETISRNNLCVSLYTTAIKILIENGVAVGVRVIGSDGNIYEVYANKEVIVSAGTVYSAKLLLNSGIGPKAHLEEKNVDVVADLPVGLNYQDQSTVALLYLLDNDTSAARPTNPNTFSVPVTVLMGATNRSQDHADYVAFIFKYSKQSDSLLQLCSHIIKYKNDICNNWYEATANRSAILVALALLRPESRGYVQLNSSDYNDEPIVHTKLFSDEEGADITLMAKSLADFHEITSTEVFQSINATLVNPGVCSNTTTDDEFWECYTLAMSFGLWNTVGTCAMPEVLDSSLRVKNVENLRVIDASAMPTEVSGKPGAAVNMLAERGADLILSRWNIIV